MDVIAYILSKKYTDKSVEAIAGGLKYKGSVQSVTDLPAASSDNKGHLYTILDNGHEYVSDGTQWIDLSADLDNKQDKLVAGDNITIAADGKTISAASTSIDNRTILQDSLKQLKTAIGGYTSKVEQYNSIKSVDIRIPDSYSTYFINNITTIRLDPSESELENYTSFWNFVRDTQQSAGFNRDNYKFKITYLLKGASQSCSDIFEMTNYIIPSGNGVCVNHAVCRDFGRRGYNPDGQVQIESCKNWLPDESSVIRLELLADNSEYTYYPIDSRFINVDNNTIKLNANNQIYADLDNKQDKLIAGSNITIADDGKTISATDTKYTVTIDI